MDNKKKELMDILTKVFSDEASTEALMRAETVEEIANIMESKEVPFTQKDCEFLLAVKEKNFVQSLPEMKSNEEVQTALEEKGFTLSLDECALLRMTANRSIMELLAKAKNTEEVRDILEENAITLSPEAYSNLEWNLEVDVELTENELADVAGGGWGDFWGIIAVTGMVAVMAGFGGAVAAATVIGVAIGVTVGVVGVAGIVSGIVGLVVDAYNS